MTLKQAKNLCAEHMVDLVFDHADFSDKYVSNKKEKREQMKDCFLADVLNSPINNPTFDRFFYLLPKSITREQLKKEVPKFMAMKLWFWIE